MPRRLTQEGFEKRVKDVWNKEYSVIGKYIDSHTRLQIKHNNCGWIYEATPNALLNRRGVCPVCSNNSKNTDINVFKQKVFNKCGNEYEVIGDFVNMSTPITMRHNNCSCCEGKYEFNIIPTTFLYKDVSCPYELNYKPKLSIEDIKESLNIYHPSYELISKEYTNPSQKLQIKCNQGHYYETSIGCVRGGHGCPICANKKLLVGYNDYQTTHYDQSKYLLDPEEGKTFIYGTNDSKFFRCPDCGKIYYKKPAVAFSSSGRFVCSCKDGFSYPEKFIVSMLDQINEPYIYQLTNKTFEWCDNYRYDFYLIDRKTIIEIHGLQHYQDTAWGTYEQIHQNDIAKRKNAEGYVNYIELNAKVSNLQYIKENIYKSDLCKILDLSSVDWNMCNIFANNSKYIEVVNYWNSGIHTASEISQLIGLCNETIIKYLDDASQNNMCDFDRAYYRKHINHGNKKVSVKCVETNMIYESFADLFKQTGIRLSMKKLEMNKPIQGYHFIKQ